MLFPSSTDPVLVILKLPGDICDIDCHYCFEKRKPYESASFLMPETLRRLLDTLGDRPIDVQLHGGEPLLFGLPRMQAIADELRRYPGRVDMLLQTNGRMLDAAWLDFFDREWPSIEIGVSLDGDAESNAHRVDYQGRPTTGDVERAIELAGERGRTIGIISVVTRRSLGRARALIDYFSRFQAIRAVNFSPCLDYSVRPRTSSRVNTATLRVLNGDGVAAPAWATGPLEYAKFLVDVFDAWRASGAFNRFLVEPLASIMRTVHGKRSRFCHFDQRKCSYVLTLYPDGRMGSCDELRMPDAFLGEVEHLGNVEDALHMRTNPVLKARLEALLEVCASCDYQSTCGGGCLATRLAYQGTAFEHEYCESRALIVDYVAAAVGAPPVKRSAAHDA